MFFSLLSYFTSGNQILIIYALVTLLLRIPAMLLSLSIHESAHGWMANKLGDPTARNLGRITINPLKHLNPLGALSMLIFGVGWANPVPINSRYFKKPKRDMALTAIAGPLSNLAQGFVATALMFVGTRLFFGSIGYAGSDGMFFYYFSKIIDGTMIEKIVCILFALLWIYATLNFSLALFNLIPIPPFDGSRLAFVFLPDKFYFGIMKYERYIMIGFLALFYFFGDALGTVFSLFIELTFLSFSWVLLI